MKKSISVTFITLGLVGVMFGVAFGESYPNGAEGLKCATLPPPGFYYKMYNAYVTADKVMDPGGDEAQVMGPDGEVPIDFDAKIFVNAHRFLWISDDIKLFGANYGADVFIPIWYKDIDFNIGSLYDYDDSQWNLGDIIIEPFVLAWHGPRYDASAAVALFLPTGDDEEPADPGENMYTTMFTLGGTYYFDEAKTWSASILGRYEIHHSDYDDTDIKPGDDFHFEWGVGKTLAQVWDVGVVGYCQWQVTEDSGSGSSSDKDRGYAIGPEVSVFIPPMKLFVSLRSEFEFSTEGGGVTPLPLGRPEGNRTWLILTKIF
jgi:hypothetical protein